LRLQQIVSGFLKVEAGEAKALPDTPREQALRDILEDQPADGKVIIWAVFHSNYVAIRKVLEGLGWQYAELHGLVPTGKHQDEIDRFMTDPTCRAIIANPQSGGIGVNLTAAATSIFFSHNFSLENDLQAEARNHRGGSERHEKITRYDLVATDTIDEIVMEALAAKQEVSGKILGDVASRLSGLQEGDAEVTEELPGEET
jgi:SNF2 family DNA or RNA helicase